MRRCLALALAPLWLSAACASPEEKVIDRYLASTQRGDEDTVAALSMVVFPERVQSWNILDVGTVRRETYLVPELREKLRVAHDERDHQFRAFGEFRQANYDALRGIGARLRDEPDYRFPGQIGELQDRWKALREQRGEVVARLHDAETALELELRRVTKSLERESSLETLTGETLQKDARVRVTTPAGDCQYTITLMRYRLRNHFEALVPARWIIANAHKDD